MAKPMDLAKRMQDMAKGGYRLHQGQTAPEPPTINETEKALIAGHSRRTAIHGQSATFGAIVEALEFKTLIAVANVLGVPQNYTEWLDDDFPDKEDALRVAVAEAIEKVEK